MAEYEFPTIEYKERGGSWIPLDWSIWSQIQLDNYSAPRGSKFRFTWKDPASFLLARRSDKFKVVVFCNFKLNRFVNISVNLKGVDHRDNISMKSITEGMWLTMLEAFDYNPLLPLVKPPFVHTDEFWKYGSYAPRLKPAQFELANFTQTELNNVMKVLQAVDYLNHCDWFNGVNPLRHMAVKGIYNKYADYISFWDEYSSDQAKGLTDDDLGFGSDLVGLAHQTKEQAYKLAKPLYRNPYLDRSKRGKNQKGKTKKVGGRLTDEGTEILFDWIRRTNQPLELLDSVRYEA